MEPVAMQGGSTAGLIDRARRARSRLDPGDPAGDALEPLLASGPGVHLDEALRLIEPLFDHLSDWPAPGARRPSDAWMAGGRPVRLALADGAARGWLAAMAALQALELGPGTPMARALAAGAVRLRGGEPDGLDWLAAAVRLSRVAAVH